MDDERIQLTFVAGNKIESSVVEHLDSLPGKLKSIEAKHLALSGYRMVVAKMNQAGETDFVKVASQLARHFGISQAELCEYMGIPLSNISYVLEIKDNIQTSAPTRILSKEEGIDTEESTQQRQFNAQTLSEKPIEHVSPVSEANPECEHINENDLNVQQNDSKVEKNNKEDTLRQELSKLVQW